MARYAVDWHISGSWEIEAEDAEDAQAKFDKAWEGGKIKTDRDAEVYNDKPYLSEDD